MKTIKDLVKSLNDEDVYMETITTPYNEKKYYLFKKRVGAEDLKLIQFMESLPKWMICSGLSEVSFFLQKDIMDFVYTVDSEHWFDNIEKRYNIILGEQVTKGGFEPSKAAYKKSSDKRYVDISDIVEEDDLKLAKYIFTESEVEDLKSKVSEHSAKIIDLGKVEVKDD